MPNLTDEQKRFIITECPRSMSLGEAQRKFEGYFGFKPHKMTIKNIWMKFDQIGSIHSKRINTRKKRSTSDVNKQRVVQAFRNDPHLSIRRALTQLGLKRMSVWRILKAEAI
jgi:hypothetical protein